MVMTFVLHPLSHYNLTIEPRALFLLSLLEGLTLTFPHFILSLIDVYKDTTTRDKVIFPSAISNCPTYSFLMLLKYTYQLIFPNVIQLWWFYSRWEWG